MGFLEKQRDPTSPMHWRGDMQADYLYLSGIAGDKFFKHLMKNDNFLACVCTKCKKIYCPPRLYCEDCYEEIPEGNWKEIPTVGTVELYTIAKLNAHGKKLASPKVVAKIKIEETDSSMLGIIQTDDVNKDLMSTKVKAILRPMDKREGTIKDILYWE
jgi:uncharacterized OB-fold protein